MSHKRAAFNANAPAKARRVSKTNLNPFEDLRKRFLSPETLERLASKEAKERESNRT